MIRDNITTGMTFHRAVDCVLVSIVVCRLQVAHQIQQIMCITVQLKPYASETFVNSNES